MSDTTLSPSQAPQQAPDEEQIRAMQQQFHENMARAAQQTWHTVMKSDDPAITEEARDLLAWQAVVNTVIYNHERSKGSYLPVPLMHWGGSVQFSAGITPDVTEGPSQDVPDLNERLTLYQENNGGTFIFRFQPKMILIASAGSVPNDAYAVAMPDIIAGVIAYRKRELYARSQAAEQAREGGE